jgi:hypothetical protein
MFKIGYRLFILTQTLITACVLDLCGGGAHATGLACISRAFLGSHLTPGYARDVRVSGDLAFVSVSGYSLDIIDISHPKEPVLIGSVGDVEAKDFDLVGTLVYLAAGYDGLIIIDVSSPSAPVVLGTYDTPGAAFDVSVVGNIAYIGDYDGGLVVLDVSDAGNPVLLAIHETTPGPVTRVYATGQTLFLSNGEGLQTLDVSVPTNPVPLGFYDSGPFSHVVVAGNAAYLALGFTGILIVDVSDPSQPTLLGSVNTPGEAHGIHVVGNTAYVADGYEGMQVIDVTDPSSPALVATFDTRDEANRVWVVDDTAYVADGDIGLDIIDISMLPTTPKIGAHGPLYDGFRASIDDELAYIANGYNGLRIVDVSSPSTPILLSVFDTPGRAVDVRASGGVAFVADYDRGLRLIDVSNPAAPKALSTFDAGNTWTQCVEVVGNVAYAGIASNQEDGLGILDVSNPAAPALLSFFQTSSSVVDAHIADGRAYLADTFYGLRIVDVSNPAAPVLLGSIATQSYSRSVTVVGNIAYLSVGLGLDIIDVSNPSAPIRLATYDAWGGTIYDLAVVGDLAFLANWSNGLHVVDVSNPSAPAIRTTYSGTQPRAITIVDDIAYTVTGQYSMAIIDISDCPPPPCPADPTNLATSEPLKGIANLTWTDNAFNESGFRIRREQFLQGAWKNAQVVATLPADTTTFAQSPGQGFWRYQVQAFTAECDSAWTDLKSVPAAAPSGLTITKVNGAARLDWTDNSNFEAKFLVQRQQKVANKWVNTTAVGNPAKNAVTFTNAPGAGTWRYRIRANSTAGNSLFTPWKIVTLP